MVVQEAERNAFDQRALEWELLNVHSIRLIRLTFSELQKQATLSSSDGRLLISPSNTEVSVVYFRAGYTPVDYPTASAWSTRLLLERSKAIKCPSVALQLAGAKKVQEVLSRPGQLERFLPNRPDDVSRLRDSFTRLFPLDDSDAGREALRLATTNPEDFVLKPQREGGGNNVYRLDIPPFLAELEKKDGGKAAGEPREREGYILMDLILPPRDLRNVLVKAGEGRGVEAEVVSELGVYGIALWDSDGLKVNETAGHLLRTKASDVAEGGVATGYSVIDSPALV
jgi:glutathione synthetase